MGSCNLLSGNIIEDFVVLEANSLFGVLVSFQYGMGNIAVRYQLDRTVVIGQLSGVILFVLCRCTVRLTQTMLLT